MSITYAVHFYPLLSEFHLPLISSFIFPVLDLIWLNWLQKILLLVVLEDSLLCAPPRSKPSTISTNLVQKRGILAMRKCVICLWLVPKCHRHVLASLKGAQSQGIPKRGPPGNSTPSESDNHDRYFPYRLESGVVVQGNANVILTRIDSGSPFLSSSCWL